MMKKVMAATAVVAAALLCTAAIVFSASVSSTSKGNPQLKSAGTIAFAPDGNLLVGDSMGAAVVSIDVNDNKAAKSGGSFDVKSLNDKIAALLATMPDQISVQDIAVNPISKRPYISVMRGRGADATPVILRSDASGNLSLVSLDNVNYSSVSLADAVAADAVDGRGQSQRTQTITSMAVVNGNVIVAGLSNEEFASTLRSIPYPLKSADKGTGVKIYHSSHQRFETQAPILAFVPYMMGKQEYLLAAYTCTPIVKISMSDLHPSGKVDGTTIGNLGERNRPLDMISYEKAGHNYFLVANSSLGVDKVNADHLESYAAITTPTNGPAALQIDQQNELKNVAHLSKLDDSTALLLVSDSGNNELRTIALP